MATDNPYADWGAVRVASQPSAPDDNPYASWGAKRVDAPQGAISWSDVGNQAMQNAVPSMKQLVSDTVQPFIHPVDTAKALGNVAAGSS